MRSITAIVVLGALLMGGCSGDDDSPDVATLGDGERSEEARGGVDTEAALLDFSECMRSEGIDGFPDLDEDSSILDVPQAGIDPFTPAFQTATEACDHHLEGVVFDLDLDPDQAAELQDTALEIVRCMRARGYELPEPRGVPDAEYFEQIAASGIDVTDPAVLADAQECFAESGFGQTDADEP